MSSRSWRLPQRLAALVLLALPVFAGSCQSLVGIEERELGPCGHFCDTVMRNCTGDNQVYESPTKCMGLCKLMEVGDSTEPQGHVTVACRQREADLAASDSSEAVTEHCRSAGPEGLNCGKTCENYCTLYEKACGVVQCGSHENCVAKCAGVRNRGEFNLVDDYEGDTIQCRLEHLTNATIDRSKHCPHATLATPQAHCNDVPDGDEGEGGANAAPVDKVKPPEPQCSDYCHTNTVACAGVEYESEDQCKAVCKHFPVGKFTDTTQNTLGCRLYHSFNSLCAPETHCPHTGPGGEGHCGEIPDGKCEAFCFLGKDICKTQWANKYPTDQDCMDECAQYPDHIAIQAGDMPDTRYTVAYGATPHTVACRFLALSRAAEDASLCDGDAVLGQGDCSVE